MLLKLQDPEKIKKYGEFFHRQSGVTADFLHYWLQSTLFHWDFFLSWFFTIIPWVLWMRYRKKKSTGRLLLAGILAILLSSWLDFIGVNFGLWYYTGSAIPTIPSYLPWDFSLIPVLFMFLLQIKPNVSPYMKAFIFTIISSLIAEPLFIWLGFYETVHWKVWYSIPIFFVFYLICYRLSNLNSFEKL
jgi:hypothetical protein